MKAFSVPEVKPFMAGLLQGSLFADWELRQAELGLACRITLQGAANMEYLTEHDTAFLHWPEIQPKIRGLIQGGRTPSFMRLTLAYPADALPDANREWIDAFLLNLTFEKGRLTLVSGIAANAFSMDKEPDRLWDAFLPAYFAAHSVLLTEEVV